VDEGKIEEKGHRSSRREREDEGGDRREGSVKCKKRDGG
jgi:hypothetical protein